MNVGRLLSIAKTITEREGSATVQTHLTQLMTALDQLIAQPQQPNLQQAFSDKLRVSDESIHKLHESFTPAQLSTIAELTGSEWLDGNILKPIKQVISENPIAPAAAKAPLNNVISKRQQLLTSLQQAQSTLIALGFKPTQEPSEEAELGFLLPRSLFGNELEGLITQLREIGIIVRAFSEATTGHVEAVTVGEISTSDPIFFLGIPAATIVAIAGSVKWLLEAWKSALDIRSFYADAKRLELSDKALEEIEAKVDGIVTAAIEKRIGELVADFKGDKARVNELANGLRLAMRSLMAKIERGMTIEVRPPAIAHEQADAEAGDETQAAAQALHELASDLQFPQITDEKLVNLPASDSQST